MEQGSTSGAGARPLVWPAALGGVLLVALALRLYGIDWDQGHLFHPDERAILMKVQGGLGLPWPLNLPQLLDPKASPLNPAWFPYGSFPLYLLKLVAHLSAFFQSSLATQDLRLVGRGLSALFDTGTVLLTFLLGARLYSRQVGLLAAALVALAVLHIQLSHFFAVDTLLTFFVLLSLLFAARVVENPRPRYAALLGVSLGLGLATKVSIAPVLITAVVACGLACFSEAPLRFRPPMVRRALAALLVTGAVGLLVFTAAQPYALLDFQTFLRDTVEQSEMVRRVRDYPYTRQYIDTAPYLYPIQQLSLWGMGLPLGILAWSGFLFTLGAGVLRRQRGDLLLLSWMVPYFLLTGGFQVKFLRYMLPLSPLLILGGARMLFAWRAWALEFREIRPRLVEAASGDEQPLMVSPVYPEFAEGNQSGSSFDRLRTSGLFAQPVHDLASRAAAFAARPILPILLAILVLVASATYALGFLNVYALPHPAVQVSRWINQHVPPGSLVLKEHWEEGLPDLGRYRREEMNLYEPDDAKKIEHIVQRLTAGDYLALYSNRLYGTIPRLPQRYPLTSRYYQLLFSGELGYEVVTHAASYPRFLGITLKEETFARSGLPPPQGLWEGAASSLIVPLGYADESFTVYDHPLVMLFQKTRPIPSETLRRLLEQGGGLNGSLAATPEKTLLLSPADNAVYRRGGTWAELFNPESLSNRLPALVWLMTIEFVGLATFPIAWVLFRPLADRGYLLAKGLGLLLVAYLPWLGGTLHLFPFSQRTILASLLLLVSVSLIVGYRARRELGAFLHTRWRLLLVQEGVFLLAFFSLYLIRLGNPDLWHPWRGGEKPMDFAYLNAVIKSVYLPPYDPWFSGGYLNYYYYGQFILATLIKLVGMVPAVAYNLAVPLLFALTVGGAFSVGYNLAEGTRQRWGAVGAATTWYRLSPVGAGFAAALGVAMLGNLDGVRQLLEGLQKVAGSSPESTIPGLSGVLSALTGAWRVAFAGATLPAFDFWRSSRMMPPTISITEFPYFTFLFADLHAHLIGLPFTLLAVGLALNLVLSPSTSLRINSAEGTTLDQRQGVGLGRWVVLLAFTAFVLGALRWINTWDFPIYFSLACGALLLGQLLKPGASRSAAIFSLGIKAGVLYGLSVLFYLPFHRSYQLFYSGVRLSPETTPVHQYLAIHGLFVFLFVSFVLLELNLRFRGAGPLRLARLLARHWSAWPRLVSLLQRRIRFTLLQAALLFYGLPALVGLLAMIFLSDLALVAFLVTLSSLVVLLTWSEMANTGRASPFLLFAAMLVGLALLLSIGVELVTLQGDIQRMNTVFKFYLQGWVLWALGGAYALWWLVSRSLRGGEDGATGVALARPGWLRRGWIGLLVVLVLGSAIYPLAATLPRVRDRFLPLPPTNDGMAYMERAVYHDEHGDIELVWDRQAISWLQKNVSGSPVILEGNAPIYRWGSRVSVYTGLPTVLGWDWHQKQQRWGYQAMVEARQQDVHTLFSAADPAVALPLLRKYGVELVYVGRLERLYYPAAGLAKFDAMVGEHLEVIYQNPQVTIYRVKQAERVKAGGPAAPG